MRLLTADPYLDQMHRAGYGSRLVLHSQHYNVALLRTLLSVERVDARALIGSAAADLALRAVMGATGGEAGMDAARRLEVAVAAFMETGLGTLELEGAPQNGGEARVAPSHFAASWLDRRGRSRTPVCAATAGYLSGALAAVYGRRFEVLETHCRAQGRPSCRFRITPSAEAAPVMDIRVEPIHGSPRRTPAPTASDVDGDAVIQAWLGSERADATAVFDGLRGTVTRLWADFYNRVSYGFEREIPQAMGSKFTNLPALVLVEAGHSSAYHTFGSILRSDRWRERVAPLLCTREEWLHAALAIANSMGWGTWRVQALIPGERAHFRVYDSYEVDGYVQAHGTAPAGKCYFARGFAAAMMNLVYVGHIDTAPELSQAHYNHLFRGPLSFRAVEGRCAAMGDAHCDLMVNPLSPGLAGQSST